MFAVWLPLSIGASPVILGAAYRAMRLPLELSIRELPERSAVERPCVNGHY